MEDNLEDDDVLIRNAKLPADVSVMLGLKECDDDGAPPVPNRSRWRPWVPTRGVMQSRTPASVLQPFPRLAARSPKVSISHLPPPFTHSAHCYQLLFFLEQVEATESDNCNPSPVVRAKSEVRGAHNPSGIPQCNVTQTSSAMPTFPKPGPDNLASVQGFLASIQLGDNHAQMLLDEGIKTHQDLLHIKEILGTESLKLIKDSLKARGFTTFEVIKFISAVSA